MTHPDPRAGDALVDLDALKARLMAFSGRHPNKGWQVVSVGEAESLIAEVERLRALSSRSSETVRCPRCGGFVPGHASGIADLCECESMPIRQHTCQSDGERCESCEAESAELSRVNAARLKLNDLRASRSSETANFHRYTITSEGASKGYFRLVEDSEGAWVTWAEVAASRSSAPTEAPWRPIETAPKDRLIIGALIHDGKVWRVHEMKHNGLAFYTSAGGSLPQMTHWTELPALASPSPAPPTEENDASR